MSHSKFIFGIFFCFIGLYSYQCLKVVPERVKLQYTDDQYISNASINVRRARRGGDYFVNVNYTVMQYFGNNLTAVIKFYEYLNNEYKPSFVQMSYKLCDLLLKDQLVGSLLRRGGLVNCPVIPGTYIMKNLYFNEEIPSVFPFEKGMFQYGGCTSQGTLQLKLSSRSEDVNNKES